MISVSKRLDLLRLGYLFSVLVPCLLAIYLHDLVLWEYLDIIFGFFFYAITGNTLNDVIEKRNMVSTIPAETSLGMISTIQDNIEALELDAMADGYCARLLRMHKRFLKALQSGMALET